MAKAFFDIPDIAGVDVAKLISQLPKPARSSGLAVQAEYVAAILASYELFNTYEINNALRLAHFFGQGLVETTFLSAKVENLNYSFAGLKKSWSHKFASDDEMRAYAGNPEKIANRIYGGRLGNGPEASGDGWKYRGRGFFQLTGRDNYRHYSEIAEIDLLKNPEILETDLAASLRVAAAFFKKMDLNAYADKNDATAISRAVNRGDPKAKTAAIGEAERILWTGNALSLIKNPNDLLKAGFSLQPPSAAQGGLGQGATGPAVVELQKKLVALGYPVDAVAAFGPLTTNAVIAFQANNAIQPANGIVDAATGAAIDAAFAAVQSGPGRLPETPDHAPAPTAPAKPASGAGGLWAAIVAGIAGIGQAIASVFSNAPKIETPFGPLNVLVLALAGVLVLAIGLVIWLHHGRKSE